MPTPITVSRSGTGWTVDVTALDLSPDLGTKDFLIQHNTVQQSLGSYQKTTPQLLTYVGPNLDPGTAVKIYRDSPSDIPDLSFGAINSSTETNARFEAASRALADFRVFLGDLSSSTTPSVNDPFSIAWDGDTFNAPTRNALYDYLIGLAPLVSPALTGVPTAPTASFSVNTTQIATTAFVQAQFTNPKTITVAWSFTGTGTNSPTCVTQTPGDNSTRVASTAFVTAAVTALNIGDYALTTDVNNSLSLKANLNSPDITGTPTAPTPGLATNSTRIATAAFVQNLNRPAFSVWRSGSQLNINNAAKVLFNNKEFDTDNTFDAVTNNRFTVPAGAAGKYMFTANVAFAPTNATAVTVSLLMYKNGALFKRFGQVGIQALQEWQIHGTTILDLVVGDFIEMFVTDFGAAGVDVNISGNQAQTWFTGHRLGA